VEASVHVPKNIIPNTYGQKKADITRFCVSVCVFVCHAFPASKNSVNSVNPGLVWYGMVWYGVVLYLCVLTNLSTRPSVSPPMRDFHSAIDIQAGLVGFWQPCSSLGIPKKLGAVLIV
jgi:hypothetical protein